MNRIEAKMKALQEKGEKAFITYITAGLPDLEGTKKLLKAQEKAGLDVVELGIPFSLQFLRLSYNIRVLLTSVFRLCYTGKKDIFR